MKRKNLEWLIQECDTFFFFVFLQDLLIFLFRNIAMLIGQRYVNVTVPYSREVNTLQ